MPLVFNTVLEVLTRAARQEKEIKCSKTGVGKTKLAMFTHEMILSTENPKEFIKKKKLLGQINEFSMVAGYKINMQKLIKFL